MHIEWGLLTLHWRPVNGQDPGENYKESHPIHASLLFPSLSLGVVSNHSPRLASTHASHLPDA